MPRPEGPFDRLLRQKPDRDPAPIIIGGTIAFLALVIVLVFVFSSVLGGGDGGGDGGGGDTIQIADGIRGKLTAMPALPPGLSALSRYIEFETDEEGIGADIGLPLTEPAADPTGLGFYTYTGNRWQRVLDVNLSSNGGRAEGQFRPLPDNLAVLRVAAQTYVVGASLPRGTSLHGDAGSVQLVSPRDYTPGADGSIQGAATNVQRPEGSLLIPTIVGSSQDTAAVVNDILADTSLPAAHIQQITTLVTNNSLDGVDLEYSSVDVDLADEYTSFVEGLADALHRDGKKLALTLPPPTAQRSAYQWDKLGAAADYIKVLPIANPVAYWDTMPDALSQITDQVDTRKVLLVVSPYSIEGSGDVSTPIGYLQAMVLASSAAIREPTNPDEIKPGADVSIVARNLDQGEGASELAWADDSLTVSFALGGSERQRIYIENSYSVAFKLELVQAYALGGLAVADGSAESDVANIWGKVHELVSQATVTLRRPNDQMLQTIWQAPDGGSIQGDPGATAITFVPSAGGQQRVVLLVSDGDRRFGQELIVEVRAGEETPTPSPLETFPPSETPTEEPEPTETPSAVLVEVGKLADGDDEDGSFSNDEIVSNGSEVTFLITIDNDSDSQVTIISLIDTLYDAATCAPQGGGDVVAIGAVLAPDDGDGTGNLDGGADQIQCTITATIEGAVGDEFTNEVTVTVGDDQGAQGSDTDATKVTIGA